MITVYLSVIIKRENLWQLLIAKLKTQNQRCKDIFYKYKTIHLKYITLKWIVIYQLFSQTKPYICSCSCWKRSILKWRKTFCLNYFNPISKRSESNVINPNHLFNTFDTVVFLYKQNIRLAIAVLERNFLK